MPLASGRDRPHRSCGSDRSPLLPELETRPETPSATVFNGGDVSGASIRKGSADMSWFGKRKDHPPVPVRGTTVDSPLDPGLAAQVQSWIERLAVPCAAIKAGSQVSSPSTSFISGHAYLPAGERWPMVDDNTYGLTFDDTMGRPVSPPAGTPIRACPRNSRPTPGRRECPNPSYSSAAPDVGGGSSAPWRIGLSGIDDDLEGAHGGTQTQRAEARHEPIPAGRRFLDRPGADPRTERDSTAARQVRQ